MQNGIYFENAALLPQGNAAYKLVAEETGAEALFVSDETYKRYVAGFLTEGGFAVADKNGTTLFTDARYLEAAEKKLVPLGVNVETLSKEVKPELYLKRYKSVAVPYSEISYAEFLSLQNCGAKFSDATNAIRECAKVKTEGELNAISRACEIAEEGLQKTLGEIKEGMTEREVAAILEHEMRACGADGTSFDTIVAFGAGAAVPHHETGDTKLKFGDEILIDFGCKTQGYCSDMTRTVVIGSASEKQREIYDTVLKAQETALLGIRPGMKGSQIDAMARDVITDAGYGKYFGHALGHSVGLEIHESPNFSPREETVIKPGMVITVEPGIYIEGIGGVRIEDVVIITEDGCENITHSTKKLLELTAQKG